MKLLMMHSSMSTTASTNGSAIIPLPVRRAKIIVLVPDHQITANAPNQRITENVLRHGITANAPNRRITANAPNRRITAIMRNPRKTAIAREYRRAATTNPVLHLWTFRSRGLCGRTISNSGALYTLRFLASPRPMPPKSINSGRWRWLETGFPEQSSDTFSCAISSAST